MSLPDSYTLKTGAMQAYFDAIQSAEAPERFSTRFLEDLGFTSSNDRLLIGILKSLGFLDTDGLPQDRYHRYLDKEIAAHVLAEGIRDAYSDLFGVNKEAHKLEIEGVFNKLRTLYKGAKKDSVVKLIARTFVALCEIADFSKPRSTTQPKETQKPKEKAKTEGTRETTVAHGETRVIGLDSLQYHINIVLPETRDQAVYDAIFKSLRDHLG